MKALLLTLATLAALPATAINKCVVDGRAVFQEAPCEAQRETVGQGRERQKRIEGYHRELDRLAAQGHGLQRDAAKAPAPPPPSESEDPMFRPRTRAQVRAEQAAAADRHREESERGNAESAARLTRMMEDTQAQCGNELPKGPELGMADARFRSCTIHARFGGVTQLVAVERDGVPLRLYIFSSEPRRVYSVDGVVTAITR